MRRLFVSAVIAATVVGLWAQPAGAKVFVGHTNLTIHVTTQSVTGKLVGRPECRPGQTIELFVDGLLSQTTITDDMGNYSFSVTAAAPSKDQTRFEGSRTGEHPDRFICAPSLSRLVVLKGHGHGDEQRSAAPGRAAVSTS